MAPPQPPGKRNYPNPFLFIAISVASYGVFWGILQYRQATNPASKQPRQYDSPLVPPRHLNRDDSPKPSDR